MLCLRDPRSHRIQGKKEVSRMPRTIEITMTSAGFQVLAGGRVATFGQLDEAVGYAREQLARAELIRAMKTRIE
jgi:hypothetical protein